MANASYVVDVTSANEVRQVYLNAKNIGQPIYVVGGGSNLIAHDDGFAGVILHNKILSITVVSDDSMGTTMRRCR